MSTFGSRSHCEVAVKMSADNASSEGLTKAGVSTSHMAHLHGCWQEV